MRSIIPHTTITIFLFKTPNGEGHLITVEGTVVSEQEALRLAIWALAARLKRLMR